MTAIASLPTIPSVPRPSWHAGNSGGHGTLNSMGSDDVSRIFMPRKGVHRTNSSSSTSSTSSSSSTSSTTTINASSSSSQPNDVLRFGTSDSSSGLGSRKKQARNPWPSAKSEPVSAVSTSRSQSASGQGQPIVGSRALLHDAVSVPGVSHGLHNAQSNGARAGNTPIPPADGSPVLCLLPMNGTFERKAISVPFFPDVLRIGRQTNAKTTPTPLNGFFDSKVLSRQHAEIWADRRGSIWIRDVKSSNGTFVNGQRLSAENRDSDPHELREQDILELGIDIVSEDQRTVVHHKVAARVEHAGFYSGDGRLLDLNFGDLDSTPPSNLIMPGPTSRSRVGSQGSMGNNSNGSATGGGSGAGNVANSNNTGGSRFPTTPGAGTPAAVAAAAAAAAGNMNVAGPQKPVNYWLTPVTMEQIVRKLATELKTAKQQTHDLQQSGEFFDAILSQGFVARASQPPQERPPPGDHRHHHHKQHQHQHVSTSQLPRANSKHLFSAEPPAPPPQQPLPEKPVVGRIDGAETAASIPSLRRIETAKPRTPSLSAASAGSSPTKGNPSPQILSLVEALASARREIDAQATRVKSLEELLEEERKARATAEDRAEQLQKLNQRGDDATGVLSGASKPASVAEPSGVLTNGPVGDDKAGPREPVDAVPEHNAHLPNAGACTTSSVDEEGSARYPDRRGSEQEAMARLQHRLEAMMTEMAEMKRIMEEYKHRAELAEQESSTSRKGLAEMVERIRQMEAERDAAAASRRRRRDRKAAGAGSADLGAEPPTSASSPSPPSTVLASSNGERCANGHLVKGGAPPQGPSSSGDNAAGAGADGADGADALSLANRELGTAMLGRQSDGTTALVQMRGPAHDRYYYDQLLQSAPYASILGVVALGVGLMAYLNGWQKMER